MFYDYNVLTRNVSIHNLSDDSIEIKRLLSANFDFNNDNYDILHLSGSWAKERHIIRSLLRSGSLGDWFVNEDKIKFKLRYDRSSRLYY